jgi:hypothetical protein
MEEFMNVKELYCILKNIGEEFGWELPIVMSVDPEGNSYCDFNSSLAVTMVRDGEDKWLRDVQANEIDWKEGKKLPVCGVCLYPFNEGYQSAEHACKGDENYDEV